MTLLPKYFWSHKFFRRGHLNSTFKTTQGSLNYRNQLLEVWPEGPHCKELPLAEAGIHKEMEGAPNTFLKSVPYTPSNTWCIKYNICHCFMLFQLYITLEGWNEDTQLTRNMIKSFFIQTFCYITLCRCTFLSSQTVLQFLVLLPEYQKCSRY